MSRANLQSEIDLSPDSPLDFKTAGMKTDLIAESTAATGVTIDGLLIKDNGISSTDPTTGIGYGTGAGGAVTQATNKSTAVTLNKICGEITMNNAALAAGADVNFQVTDSVVAVTDVIIVCIASGTAAANKYALGVGAVAAGSFNIYLTNLSAGSLSEALVLNFAVIKAVSA